MRTREYIRCFIRHYGELRAVAVSTLLLVLSVTILAIVIDLLLYQAIKPVPIYFSALLTLIAGPVILYWFVSLISRLDQADEKLRALSIMDDLTDVYNRRFFLEQAEKELAKAQRYGTVFSVLIVDIDRFRAINDEYGHSAGDAVLQHAANTCMNNLRAMDVFARYGGDAFAFLIPESDKINVDAFAKKVLSALEETVVVMEKQDIRFTVSVGVRSSDDESRSLEAILKDAESALHDAKQRGHNCVVVYDAESNN